MNDLTALTEWGATQSTMAESLAGSILLRIFFLSIHVVTLTILTFPSTVQPVYLFLFLLVQLRTAYHSYAYSLTLPIPS